MTDAAAAGASGAGAGGGGDDSVAALLARFAEVQAHRAHCYGALDAAFRGLLATGAEGPYRRALQALTPEFSDASSAVRAFEAALAGPRGRPDLAALLRGVQEGEREKLRLTLALQALRQAHAAGNFSWQKEGAEEANALEPPAAHAPAAAHDHGHGEHSHGEGGAANGHAHGPGCCGHGAGGSHPPPPPEPTQAEWEAAVREATRGLDAAISAINEALEELRYAELP
jgi:hypothetical protein